jgi:hypothetical protein
MAGEGILRSPLQKKRQNVSKIYTVRAGKTDRKRSKRTDRAAIYGLLAIVIFRHISMEIVGSPTCFQ